MNIFYVCTNDETIVSGHLVEGLADDYSEHAAAYWSTACSVIDDEVVDREDFGQWSIETDGNFRNWNGGIHCLLSPYKIGRITVWTKEPCPAWAKDLADRAHQAGVDAMVKSIESELAGTDTVDA